MEKEIELEQEAIVVYSGGGAVNSVNGYTGDVVLTTSDLENTSDYQTGTEVESAISTAIAGKQDNLTAGNNITISNNTISATDTTYSAGTGLTLNGTQFSVDTSTIATQQDVSDEATARENADINLQGQIDAISAASDVTDIVGTYADLQAYDTQHLKDNDIIKVLQDESQNDETTYYRWSTSTQTFTLIGEEGPYYTKSQTDTLLQAKQDNLTAGANITIASDNTISATDTTYTAGTNVSISSGNVISATDTTYSDFTGTDGTAAGTAGLVPAPATTDAGKFLKADGTWDTAGGGGVTELTTADIDYPDASPTGIALWRLDSGTYYIADASLTGFTNTANESTSIVNQGVYIIGDYGTASKSIVSFDVVNSKYWVFRTNKNTGAKGNATSISPSIVQTTGTSTTDVMSQNAVTSMVFKTPSTLEGVRIGKDGVNVPNGTGATGIGDALTNGNRPVAIGNGSLDTTYRTRATGDDSVAIGTSASVLGYKGGIALGAYSNVSSAGEMNIGSSDTTAGYNSSNYRLLTGLYDGQSAHDAATKGQLDSIAIQNAGAPTTATVGTVGQLLEDTTNGKLYICTDTTGGTYTWEEVGSGGGSGPTVVQTTGTSTTDVMSQNAVTSMVFADPGSNMKVRIGAGADNIGQVGGVSIGNNANNGIGLGKSYVVGIGTSAKAGAEAAVAIGLASSANGVGSIALGARAQATSQGEMNIGTSLTSYGYNSSNYRLLTGLYDPQSAHDAATKGYVDPTTDSSAPTTATVGRLGQIQIDTTTATAYMCVAVDTVTPAYTWKQITA